MGTFQKTPRKKLWGISPFYHCSVAGTCLSLDETRKIFRKCGIEIPSYVRDYEVHGSAVRMSSAKNEVSKRMHNFIEQKYSYYVNIFSKAENEEELMCRWEEFLEQGNVAGAYWALMTHPSVSQENRDMAFGEVHMLSHLNGSSNRANIREIEEYKKKNTALAEINNRNESLVTELKSRIKRLKEKNDLVIRLQDNLKKAEDEIIFFKSGLEIRSMREDVLKLSGECSRLTELNTRLETSLKSAGDRIFELDAANEKLCKEAEYKDEELSAIENSFIPLLQREPSRCSECRMNFDRGIDLCGKCILYVGGRLSVVNRCREMVEFYGGRFIHHDGGKEESLARLPAVFHRADFIFCPLDCVSHNACLYVKKMSQRHQKQFMFLKSSGLSTFLKEINDIAKSFQVEQGLNVYPN